MKKKFLNIIVTDIFESDVIESWVHYYEPENKRQSMKFRHKALPWPKKFRVHMSAGKVILTVLEF